MKIWSLTPPKTKFFEITDICTANFIQRLEKANGLDSKDYATWLLRSGMQYGDDTSFTYLILCYAG